MYVRVGATERPDYEVARILGDRRGAYCPLLGGWLVSLQYADLWRWHNSSPIFSLATSLWLCLVCRQILHITELKPSGNFSLNSSLHGMMYNCKL